MPSQRRITLVALVPLLAVTESNGFTACPMIWHPSIQEKTALAFVLCMTSPDGNDFIDAVVEASNSSSIQPQIPGKQRRGRLDMFKETFQRLAQLSLEDYKWRSGVFKSQEADRLVEASVARMRGEEPAYVRPMDAADSKIGPMGKAEKIAVGWLSKVIEEEGRRAEMIARSEGLLVRPMDASKGGEIGPLAAIEKAAVNFFDSIRNAEKERFVTGIFRPKDLDEGKRGPLGDAEAKAVATLNEISRSENLRMEQSRLRGGEIVRPIDIPGPLGEFERTLVDVFIAEQQRVKDREANDGILVRPKDATLRGPLGQAELDALKALERLTNEERERFKNIQRVLEENRPMEVNPDSVLGASEALMVGIFRAPQLLFSVVDRVKELLASEDLSQEDKKFMMEAQMHFDLKLPDVPTDGDSNIDDFS